jgi:ankyrin repeat protein
MGNKKQPPRHIALALEALKTCAEDITASDQEQFKKILPIYAVNMRRAGHALSLQTFVEAIDKGCMYIEEYNKALGKKPQQSSGFNYQAIVAQLPKPQNVLNAMFLDALEEKDFDTAREALKQGAQINAKNNRALHSACRRQDVATLNFLIEQNIDLCAIDCIPILLASSHCDISVVKLLHKNGADIQAHDNQALLTATMRHDYELVKFLLQNGADAKAQDSRALYRADIKTAKILLKYGADPAARESSVLRDAIQRDDYAMAELLLDHGADPNARGRSSIGLAGESLVLINTMLNLALSLEHDGEAESKDGGLLIKLLLDHGADPLADNAKAIKIALSKGQFDAFEILRSHCPDLSLLDDETRASCQRFDMWQQQYPDMLEKYDQLLNYRPYHFDKDTFEAVYQTLSEHEGYNGAIRTLTKYAYNAACLFKSADRLQRYFKRWGEYGSQPLHDVIQDIKIPQKGALDLKAWGDAVLAHGPKMARLVEYSDRLAQPMKGASDGWSYNKTKAEIAQHAYDNGRKHPLFAQHCYNFTWSERYFEQGLKLIAEYEQQYAANDNKKGSAIPDITLDGEAFDKEGYRFRRLEDGDVKGLLLGEFTNCCQHLANQGADCARYGFISEHSGFYVVEDKKTSDIVAQSWAWRGDKGELVFDSLESLAGHFNAQQWAALCAEFSDKLKKHAQLLAIPSFHVGTSGGTPKAMGFRAEPPANPIDYDGYRDSTLQYLVARYK